MKRNLPLIVLLFSVVFGLTAHLKAAAVNGVLSAGRIAAPITDGFITTWETTQPNESILIPINPAYSLNYNYTVNWGDGAISNGQTGNATHIYSTAGIHTVTITGDFPAIQFKNTASDPANDLKLRTVEKWGNGTWNGMDAAFQGCQALTTVENIAGPLFAPNSTLYSMFYDCILLNCDLNNWDLTNVREISYMFCNAVIFNGDISSWNVSNVTNMQNLFDKAYVFNRDISDWDVSKVTLMDNMFVNARAFNGYIGDWDVSHVENMHNMFFLAFAFNQDIGKWDVSNVTQMYFMFNNAPAFNQDLNDWNVSKVTDFSDMFEGASAFNGKVSDWDVSHVTNMTYMFNGCGAFNQDLSAWDVSSAVNLTGMFLGAASFNSDISSWDVSHVQNMQNMFNGAAAFNQNIGGWQTNSLKIMDHMFMGASAFNQNIENWNVTNVTSMDFVFNGASAFNQNIGKWDISRVTSMHYMLDGSGLSPFNYESTLNTWALKSVQPNVTLGAAGLKYCSISGRQSLTVDDNWEILQDRRACLVTAIPDATGIVYVDSAIAIPGDGSSWGTALNYLSDATESAKTNTAIKEIHIAKGTYYPTGYKDLPYIDSTFWLTRAGLKIQGGYANGGGAQDSQLYPTILSGDIGNYADTSDNSLNVLVIRDIPKGADSLIVDGVTITGGKSVIGVDFNGYGFAGGVSISGAYANTVIRNCRFIDNYGMICSALGILGQGNDDDLSLVANPQIIHCLFLNNRAMDSPLSALLPYGSPIINFAASPFVSHCDFIQNSGLLGGAVSNTSFSTPVFYSCTFTGNSAKGMSVMNNYQGGNAVLVNCLITNNFNTGFNDAMMDAESSRLYSNAVIANIQGAYTRLINTTIANNTIVSSTPIADGPTIFNSVDAATYMTNSIIYGNRTNRVLDTLTTIPSSISYSLIQGLAADPNTHMQDGLSAQSIFIDSANGNFQLVSPSPLINGGINDSLIAALAPYFSGLVDGGLDLADQTRIMDGIIDIGPFESASSPLPVNLAYFSGTWQNTLGMAQLHWKSGVEAVNLEHYGIEKSTNGKDFYEISSKKATGSNNTYDYSTAQVEPTAYYRLKAVETDGKFDYSNMVKIVHQGSDNDKGILLYPNPAKNHINVRVQAGSLMQIYSAAGSLVQSENLKAGVNKIDISKLSAGVYFGIIAGQKLQFVKQ